MRKITQTIVGTTPPLDKNVLWLDTTNSNSPVEKVFLNGAWIPTSAAGGEYYTKDEVDENFMGKIDDPNVGNILVMNENGKAVDSLAKLADFISNPEGGEYADVLTLNSNKEPVWTPLTPGGDTIDTEMIDGSEHAVQNGVIKKYVDNNCARKDGYYSTLTAGAAENLVGENAVEAEYTYRPSNGTIGTNTGIANVTTVKGKTLKWNQLVQIPTDDISTEESGITVVDNRDGSYTVSGTASANFSVRVPGIIPLKAGKKYLYKGCPAGGSNSTYKLSGSVFDDFGNGAIYAATSDGEQTMYIIVRSGTVISTPIVFRPQFFDLTDLFGEGNEPTTVAEFEALYPLDYYAYTATPVLKNNAASGIVTTEFNQWDEEWRHGGYNPTTGAYRGDISNVCNVNPIPIFPNTDYYFKLTGNVIFGFYYDAEMNYFEFAGQIQNQVFHTPVNARYMNFYVYDPAYTYNHDICINLSDPAKNGIYEPYEKHTFYFDKVLQGEGSLATIKGKLNGGGESVVAFPDGLKRVGNTYDEINGNVAIKRIGSVDMGTLNYNYLSGQDGFTYVFSGAKPSALAVCTKYTYNSTTWGADKTFGFNNTTPNPALWIKDSSYTDAATFKAAMSGVILYYELATPEIYILDQTVTGGYQVNALGTEQRLPEDTASAVNAPVNYSVIYPIDAVGTITKLPINYISEKSLTNFTTELASKLGTFLNATIGISATYNQTTQEYDYSITITSNE